MSDRTVETTSPIVGSKVSQYQPTVLQRGSVTLTMTGTTGTATVNLNQIVSPTTFNGMYRAAVTEWSSGGGTTNSLQAPYIVNSGASVTLNLSFYLSTYVTPGIGNELDLVINYYKSTGVSGDVKYLFYTIYSETTVPLTGVSTDWDYKA